MTGVNIIGKEAFKGKNSLKEVTVDTSLKVIESSAFENCGNLERVWFKGSKNNLTNIGDSAFRNCSSLVSAASGTDGICGDSLCTIGKRAFENCVKYQLSLYFYKSPSLTKIGEYAFHNTCIEHIVFKLGDSQANVSTIEPYTFANCRVLRYITFCDSIKEIKDHAFYQSNSIGIIEWNQRTDTWIIPQSVNSIGGSAFQDCKDINFQIPCSVTYIGDDAFRNLSGSIINCAEYSYASEYLEKNNIEYKTYNEKIVQAGAGCRI